MWVIKAATTVGPAISQLEVDKRGKVFSFWLERKSSVERCSGGWKKDTNYHVRRTTDPQEVA